MELVSDFGFRISNFYYRIGLTFIVIAAFAMVLLSTRWGIATSSDSARYIRSARHALEREVPVSSPIDAPAERAHYPPGYSTLLVLASLGGADPLVAARWVQALLMAANVLVAAEMVRRFSGSAPAALLTGLWTALLPASLFIHTWALSEPLFIGLMMLGLGAIASHIARPRMPILVTAALLCGTAILTRYLGVALIPTGAAALILLSRDQPWRIRLRDAAIFVIIAALPPALWSLRNALVLGSATNRVIAFHPVTLAHIGDAAQVFCAWLFKSDHTGKLLRALAGVIVIAVMLAGLAMARRRGREGALAGVLLISVALFALTLAWSISFVDFHTPVDVRILAPMHAVWLVLVGLVLAETLGPNRPLAITAFALAILFLVGSAARSGIKVTHMHRDGEGFAHAIWRNSATINAVRQLPHDLVIYTNAPGALYLLTGRPVIITIPAQYSASSRLPNPEYAGMMERISEDLRGGRAVIVYLKRYARRRWYYPTEEELKKALGLHPRARFNDGTIWDYVEPSEESGSSLRSDTGV